MRDEAVIAAIKNRDEEMIARVIQKYSRLLWPIVSAVLHAVGSEQDAEECVADVFIYLWEYPDKFSSERGSLKTWLCILARSRAIDHYREIIRKSTLPLEEAFIYTEAGLQDSLLWKEDKQALWKAVSRLEEPNREILIRRYYYDQKPRQIALALGLNVKQVDNSLYRSKRQLRELLTEKGGTR